MKNWTVKDAAIAIIKGTNVADVREISQAYPLFALAVARGDVAAVISMMPDKLTLDRIIQTGGVTGKAVEAKGEPDENQETDDYSELTKEQLYKLCIKRGLKVAKTQKPKQYYIEALLAADAEEADEEQEVDEYAGKTAKELFTMCKKRGIEVKPRQDSSVYIEALKAADAEEADEEDAENWDDEPEEKEAPKGKAKAKAKEEADEEEEDWDI